MKKGYKFLSLAMALCIIFSMCSICATITASAAAAIEIDTAEELRLIGRDSAYPMNGNYVLTADIDLGDAEWVPIGIKDIGSGSPTVFTGTFDGQGHVISNMWTENRSGETPTYRAINSVAWGFIASAGAATIKNVAFKDVYFNLGRAGQNTEFIGVVAGRFEKAGGKVSNVAVLSGTVNCTNFAHQVSVGGITTVSTGTAYVTINNCYNAADITVKHLNHSRYSSYASGAGIVTIVSNNANNIIKNCFNAGKISVTGYSNNTYTNFAGNIVARTGKETVVCNATLKNNLAADNSIVLSNAIQLSEDVASVSVIYSVDAGISSNYSALTSLADSNGAAIWSVADGYYPILSTFTAYAKQAEVANYILIETAEELALIGNDEAYPLSGYYKIANDIDLSQNEWTPIGVVGGKASVFTGLIEGNGYTLSGMNIGKGGAVSRTYSSYGLVATLSGTVRNLKLENVYLNSYVSGGTNYIGAIAGSIGGGKILNVYTSGVIIDTTSKNIRAGGTVGVSTAAWYIKNVFSDVDITAGYSAAVTGGTLGAAGIIGSAETSGSLLNSISVGRIDARYPGYIGAIISHYFGLDITANLTNCYSNADLDYWATPNMKAFNPKGDTYTKVSEYEMLCGALAGKMPQSDWTDNAKDLIPYLNVFEVPPVSTQTEEDAASAVAQAIKDTALTNYTTAEDITAVAEGCLELSDLEFAITNFALTDAITTTEGNLEITFTVGQATRQLTLSIEAIPAFDYSFSTKYVGRADGTITVTDKDYSGKNYRLYWGDDNGALSGYDVLATINDFAVTDETNGILTYNTIKNTLIPETATKLYLAVDFDIVTEFAIPSWRILSAGELKYISAHISDTHVGYNRSNEAMTKVFNKLQSVGGSVVTISGDITDRGNSGDYTTYKQIHNSKYSDITVWPALGNHDILVANRAEGVTAQQALSNAKNAFNGFANPNHTLGSSYVVTVPDESEENILTTDSTMKDGKVTVFETEPYILQTDYTMTYKDDMYVFMSVGKALNASSSTNDDVALTTEQLNWLDKVLNNYYNVEKKNGQAYFIFHYATIENKLGGDADSYENYDDSSAKLYEILDKYPVIHISGHTHIPLRSDKNIYVGTNHTAIQTPSITKGHQAYEGYLIEHYEGYTLIKAYNFLTGEYIPNAMFYVAKEYQCNPEVIEGFETADIDKNNYKKGTVTFSQTKVYDNRLISYNQNVFKLTVPKDNGYVGAYAFAYKTVKEDDMGYNSLWNWRNNNGDMRFYIKNDSTDTLKFKPYLYSTTKSTVLSQSSTVYCRTYANNYITIEANSGWVEIRLPFSAFYNNGNAKTWLGKGNTTFRIGLLVGSDGLLNTSGGAIYMSNVEFHDHKLTSDITTDFDREYKGITTLNKDTNWKSDGQGYITRTVSTTNDTPFFKNIVTYTATSKFDITTYNEKQVGFTHQDNVPYDEFVHWAVYNPNAELRFWIKTEKDITLLFELLETGSGTNKAIKANVSVKCSKDWQEIRLSRSDFSSSSPFDNVFSSGKYALGGISLFLRDITAGMEAGDTFSLSRYVDFFNHEAYEYGDANKDDVVDIRDIIRTKKMLADGKNNTFAADIDNNGKLLASDLAYIRKWLLTGKW